MTHIVRLHATNNALYFRAFTADRAVAPGASRAVLDIRIPLNTNEMANAQDPANAGVIQIGPVGLATAETSGTFINTAGHVEIDDYAGEPTARRYQIKSYLSDRRMLALMGRVYAPNAPTWKPEVVAEVEPPQYKDEDPSESDASIFN